MSNDATETPVEEVIEAAPPKNIRPVIPENPTNTDIMELLVRLYDVMADKERKLQKKEIRKQKRASFWSRIGNFVRRLAKTRIVIPD